MFSGKIHIMLGGAATLVMGAMIGSVLTKGGPVQPSDRAEARVMSAVLTENELEQARVLGTEHAAPSQPQVETSPARGPRIVQAPPATQATPGNQAGPPAAAPPPLPPPIAFRDALLKAANDLFSKANLEAAPE